MARERREAAPVVDDQASQCCPLPPGVAPLALGRLSDALGSSVDPMQMRYALIACPVACAAAALVLWRGSAAMDRAS